MSRRRDATRLAITGVVVAALVAGPTYALWGRDSEGVGGLVRHGDLDVELVGAAAWQETSPDVAAPRAGEVLDDGTVDHLATPGDSLTLTQEFRPRLVGDNLAARLTVSWDDGFSAPAGVEATYVVVDPDGAATEPAPLGSAVVLQSPADNLTPAEVAAWGDAPWRIVVTASLTGDVPLAEPDASGEVPGVREAVAASLGGIRIELAQVRDGKGFTS
ncbi:hypothetical protein [Cellulomonas shaoxiangyii]|uniref:Alternate-type signal peptide domain-containing protein n=1 Tax=Cellulomonas shaoxiangyii TaxID=2566013 RepID=A0A4P7SL09_9CELL|nr:hypothetical protein [Cellulomonas shaoxiangyii]QCB93856.1 hypothetical protein E5225_10095 [Cellulomonas shaoxiangyii]TGY84585.1 hypothetical protein E5226_10565 [Cellulomonas shaoxiangyii]